MALTGEVRATATEMVERDLDLSVRALLGDDWLVSTVADMLARGDRFHLEDIGSQGSWPATAGLVIDEFERLYVAVREVEVTDPAHTDTWEMPANTPGYASVYRMCSNAAAAAARAATEALTDRA